MKNDKKKPSSVKAGGKFVKKLPSVKKPLITGELDLTTDEIEAAMDKMEGFIDITPDDFAKIYHLAYKKAREKAIKHTETPVQPKSALMKFLRPISEPAPRVHLKDIAWSWVSALVGISLVSWLHYGWFSSQDLILIVGSFGASAVLIYGAIKSPLAQPRNFLGGHLVSSFAGVLAWQLFSATPWFAAGFAVATAIGFMHLTRTVHPPGGATALIAVIGGEGIHRLGFGYMLLPVLSGALIMFVVAMVFNNIVKWRKYPEFWL
jgi:CBS-domain-containing membrane protein